MIRRIIEKLKKYWDNPKVDINEKSREEENREKDLYHDERNIGEDNYEFLIRRVRNYESSDDFQILEKDYKEVFTPNRLNFENYRLTDFEYCEYKVLDSRVFITSEFVGIQVVIENNGIDKNIIKEILNDVRNNIVKYTGHSAQIFEV